METEIEASMRTKNLGENPFSTAKRMALNCCEVAHFIKLSHYFFYEIDFRRQGDSIQEDYMVINYAVDINL